MAAAGVETTFVCPPRLHRLLSSGSRRASSKSPPDERFDAQIAISSLPRAFGTRLDAIPADVPYLGAEAALVEKWAERIGPAGFKIGVVWQGNPHPEADRARSIPLARARAARDDRRRQAHLAAEGFRRGATERFAAGHAGRNAGRGLRRRPRRLRRRRGGDDAPRSRRHLRHVDRPSGRRFGAAGLGRAEERRRMAVDDGADRFALVPDDAALPPAPARRLEGGVRRDGGRAPTYAREPPRRE